MTPLETAILRTVLYADVFNFPMTVEEIHHFLMHDVPVTCDQVRTTLRRSAPLQKLLITNRDYIACAHRAAIIDERARREQATQKLWPLAVQYGAWLGRLPFVRMVAITGALAMRNAATPQDDLDYLLVTTANRVWLARAFAIIVVRLVRLRGVVICPNYVLAEDRLEQEQKDLFIAHEIAQMIPVCGQTLYQQFRAANQWADAHLPNAGAPFYAVPEQAASGPWGTVKGLLERALGGRLGDHLEAWEYRRKLVRFAPEAQTPGSAAKLDEHRVKGHFNDYGAPVLRKYQQRLHDYQLEDAPVTMAGD